MGVIGPVEAAETFADHVCGTATTSSIENILTELDLPPYANDMTFCATLDQLVFECTSCGWWCGVDELHYDDNGFVCDECSGGE